MKEIKAPNKIITDGEPIVFLAGSIEMGVADNWQSRIVKALAKNYIVIANPRRDNWDSSWKQEIDNPQFREQVEWELNAMEQATIIPMVFDPKTKSPITLLELGIFAGRTPWTLNKLIVYCPDGYWRKGNVDIVCRKYKILQVINEQDLILTIKQKLSV